MGQCETAKGDIYPRIIDFTCFVLKFSSIIVLKITNNNRFTSNKIGFTTPVINVKISTPGDATW